MWHVCTTMVSRGTPKDLIRAASLGARVATRWRRGEGRDDDKIRREVLAQFCGGLALRELRRVCGRDDHGGRAAVPRGRHEEAPAQHRSR